MTGGVVTTEGSNAGQPGIASPRVSTSHTRPPAKLVSGPCG